MNRNSTLLLLMLIGFGCMPCLAFDGDEMPPRPVEPRHEMKKPPINAEAMAQKKAEFEKRLQLTEEQKAKAGEIRQKGREEIAPLMQAVKTKRQELKKIRESRIAIQDQQERSEAVKKEIRELNKKIHEVKIKNMKEFESILTKKQLGELKKMKEEGRKKFEKQRKANCKCKKGECKCGQRPMRPKFGAEDMESFGKKDDAK